MKRYRRLLICRFPRSGAGCRLSPIGIRFVTLALAVLAASTAAEAQTHYTFTKIADTVQDPDAHIDGISCVGLSNSGTVVIYSGPGVWRGNGTGGLTFVAQASPVCPSINDLDQITHYVFEANTNTLRIVRNDNGVPTTIASTAESPYLTYMTHYLAPLSHSGNAAFLAAGSAGSVPAGIYIGPGSINVINSSTDPQITNYDTASMNDNLVVAFRAFNTLSSKWGVYRGSALPLVEDGGPTITNLDLNRPVINNSGRVAFVGRDASNNTGVFATNDGVNFTFIGTGALQPGHDRISINNNAVVAFDGTLSAGSNVALYVGDGSGPATPVISAGDTLDGLVVQSLFMWEEALNDNGQLAFWAALGECLSTCTTSRWGVFRADPNRPPVASDGTASVAFATTVSGFLSATDPDGDPLAFSIVTNGSRGFATITNAANGAYTYTAIVGPSGTDTFTFKATDGFADSNTATVNVTITPPCAADISATVTVSSQGAAKLNKKTGRYTQSLTLKNGVGAVTGPISLVLDNLSSNATLFNASGATVCTGPSGRPYINVDVGTDSVFDPRERATVALEFTNPSGQPIAFTTRVLAGANR